jgi:hypothetical protein
MANDAEYGPRPAWDRVGRLFEDVGRVTLDVYSRNLTLWGTISQGLRTSKKYGGDELARDAGRVLAAALDNADDIWTAVTRPPERQEVATSLPTAFLFFGRGTGEPGTTPLAGPVWIRLGPSELAGLPGYAKISIDGPEKGIAPLKKRLQARRVEGQGYKIEDIAEIDPTAVEPAIEAASLVPGFYGGIVYLDDPVRPLANLRIVVQTP